MFVFGHDSFTNMTQKSNECKRGAPGAACECRKGLTSSRERRPFSSRAHSRILTSVDLYAHDKKPRESIFVPANAYCSALSLQTYFLSNRKRSIAFIACCRIVADEMHSKGMVIIIARRCLPRNATPQGVRSERVNAVKALSSVGRIKSQF